MWYKNIVVRLPRKVEYVRTHISAVAYKVTREMGPEGKSYALLRRLANNWRLLFAGYAGMILLSSLLFWWFESVSYLDALWGAVVTPLPIPFEQGGFYPITLGSKIVAALLTYALLLGVTPMIVAQVMKRLLFNRNEFSHEEQEEAKKERRELLENQRALLGRYGAQEDEHDVEASAAQQRSL